MIAPYWFAKVICFLDVTFLQSQDAKKIYFASPLTISFHFCLCNIPFLFHWYYSPPLSYFAVKIPLSRNAESLFLPSGNSLEICTTREKTFCARLWHVCPGDYDCRN